MNCISGKRSYFSEQDALDALVENHVSFQHRPGSGPVNVYQCPDCGEWHFTSKGAINPALKDQATVDYIKAEQKKRAWEQKYR